MAGKSRVSEPGVSLPSPQPSLQVRDRPLGSLAKNRIQSLPKTSPPAGSPRQVPTGWILWPGGRISTLTIGKEPWQWRRTNSGPSRAFCLQPSDLVPVVRRSSKWSLTSLGRWKGEEVEPYLQLSNVVGRQKIHCFDFFFLWNMVRMFHLVLYTHYQ